MKNILILFFMAFLPFEGRGEIEWSFPPYTLSSPNENASDPQIGIDPHGNVVAVWIESGLVKSRTKIDGTWSSSSTLSNSGASSPRLSVDPNGNATVVWLESGRLNAATKPWNEDWGSYAVLSSSGASSPEIAVDHSGNAIVIWVNNAVIQSATKLINGNWPSSADTISTSGADAPQVAIGANGNVVAVWQRIVGGVDTIFSARKSINGNWGLEEQISTAVYNSVYPQVAIDVNGNAVAIWFRYHVVESVYSDVVLQAASKPMNGSWSAPVNISKAGMRDPADLMNRVGFDSFGNALVIWTTSFDTNYFEIQAAEKPVNKGWVESVSIGSGLYTYEADLSVSPIGDAYVAYMTYDAGTSSMIIQVTETDINAYLENFWAPAENLSMGGMNGYARIATNASETSHAAIVWINFNGTNYTIQSVSGEEDFFPPPARLSVVQNINNLGILEERYNILSWEESPYSEIDGYLIFRNGVLATRTNRSVLEFIDHNRKQGESVTYGVAAFNNEGSQSPILYINFPEENQKNLTKWW